MCWCNSFVPFLVILPDPHLSFLVPQYQHKLQRLYRLLSVLCLILIRLSPPLLPPPLFIPLSFLTHQHDHELEVLHRLLSASSRLVLTCFFFFNWPHRTNINSKFCIVCWWNASIHSPPRRGGEGHQPPWTTTQVLFYKSQLTTYFFSFWNDGTADFWKYMYVYTYLHAYIYICIYVYVYIYVRINVLIYICMYIRIHICIYIRVYIRIY